MPPEKRRDPATSRGPRITVLSSRQAEAVLTRNHVGRVAFATVDQRIEIQPVHYILSNKHIYGRTSFGSKYVAWLHRPYVAFEVDEIDATFDWRSVVVHGTVHVLTDGGTPAEREDFRRASAAIRSLMPAAFTPRDPTPYRSVIFRIEPHEITGRAASTK